MKTIIFCLLSTFAVAQSYPDVQLDYGYTYNYPMPVCACDTLHLCVTVGFVGPVQPGQVYPVQFLLAGQGTNYTVTVPDYRVLEDYPACGNNGHKVNIVVPCNFPAGASNISCSGGAFTFNVISCYTGINGYSMPGHKNEYVDIYGKPTELKPGELIFDKVNRRKILVQN